MPNFFPLISVLVTNILLDTSGMSCFSQSTFTSLPIKAVMASASFSEQTTNS
jgi:hypothetical protein